MYHVTKQIQQRITLQIQRTSHSTDAVVCDHRLTKRHLTTKTKQRKKDLTAKLMTMAQSNV